MRVSRPTLATEIADLRIDKPGTTVRNFRLAPENVIRGRVVSSKGEPIAGATVHAVRNAEDPVASGEAQSADDGTFALGGLDSKRYYLRASKFGWLPETLKWTVAAPAKGIAFKLARTGVIRGKAVDADGEGQANATVVALLSGRLRRRRRRRSSGASTATGTFAQDRFQAGTYYLWARHGEMLVYPPEKIEISRSGSGRRGRATLSHKGARVRGRVVTTRRASPSSLTRAPCSSGARRSRSRAKRSARSTTTASSSSGRCCPGATKSPSASARASCRSPAAPREVEIPIDPGATVDLPEPITVRPAGRGVGDGRRDVAAASAGRACGSGSRRGRGGSRSRTR